MSLIPRLPDPNIMGGPISPEYFPDIVVGAPCTGFPQNLPPMVYGPCPQIFAPPCDGKIPGNDEPTEIEVLKKQVEFLTKQLADERDARTKAEARNEIWRSRNEYNVPAIVEANRALNTEIGELRDLYDAEKGNRPYHTVLKRFKDKAAAANIENSKLRQQNKASIEFRRQIKKFFKNFLDNTTDIE